MSQAPDLAAKYEKLLRDSKWPYSNRAARRAIRELLNALKAAQ